MQNLYTRITFVCLLLLLGVIHTVNGQRPGGGFGGRGGGPTIKGNVKGEVIDASTGDAVEFATIVLLKAADSSQVDGTLTETNGKFRLGDVPIGRYLIKVSFIGYEELIIDGIETTKRKPDYDLERIELGASAVALETLEVTDQAAIVENRIDKIVYNAAQDATNQGGNAADVLRKAPLLSVDLEGNVSLRGSENIQVLINGRPSTIFAGSIGDALQSIPGDQIKSVEVITTPGARYDGEGSGGIINIITKKGEAQGFTSTVETSIGTRQNSANISLNAVKGRFGVNAGVNSFWSWARIGESAFFRRDFDDTGATLSTLDQNGENRNRIFGLFGNGGAFYDFNAFNSINFGARVNSFDRFNEGNIVGQLVDAEISDVADFQRLTDEVNERTGFDLNLDYRKTFPNQEGREFIFALQLSGTDTDAENDALQDGDLPIYQDDIFNFNDGLNLEYTGQIDYVQPFGKSNKFETGVKAVIRRIDSDYRTSVRADDNSPLMEVPLLTDLFFYDQDVYAAFVSFNLNLGQKWGTQIGARYEHTEIGGDYESETPSFRQDYDNILPSIIVNYKLSQFSGLKLSYNQRIQRPNLRFINPYANVIDPNNISIGNPFLDPERVDQIELAYNTFIKGIVLNGAVYFRRTSDLIESFLTVNPETNVGETTFLNIGEQENIGGNIFLSFRLWDRLQLRGSFNIFNYSATGFRNGVELSREAIIWNGNIGGSFDLKNDWSLETFGFFRSPRQTLQGFTAAFSLFSLGLQKKISDRTRIGLRAVEPFLEDKVFDSELDGQNFTQSGFFSIPFRSIGISISHRFGQIDFKERQRRSRIRNNDQKDDGGNNQF
ncbi:MAG: TonB-dependent receptor [Bacteroidota bacterium]